MYIPLSTHTLVIATPYPILPFNIASYWAWGWQRKLYLFTVTIIFINKMIFRWKWLPFPIKITNTRGLSLIILQQDGATGWEEQADWTADLHQCPSRWTSGRGKEKRDSQPHPYLEPPREGELVHPGQTRVLIHEQKEQMLCRQI